MDISLYIGEILQDNGKVNVPGVGTFYRKKVAAYFDQQRKIYFPPSQKLSFEQTDDDDHGLCEYISKAENISTATAEDIIREFSIKFNYELEASGARGIEGIGILKKEDTHYSLEGFPVYGLQPIQELESVSAHTPLPHEFITDDTAEVDLGLMFQETEEVAENQSALTPDTGETAPSAKRWLLIGTPILLLLAGVLYFFYPQIKNYVDNTQVAEPPLKEAPKPQPIPQDPEDSLAYQQLEQTITPDTVSYEVIVVTFSKKADAEAYIKQLTAKGNKAEAYLKELTDKGERTHIVEKSSHTFEVSIGSFRDMTSAQIEKQKAFKNISQQTWIDKVQLKPN